MKRVALHTLGCKLNFAETSTIGRQFVTRGYELVSPDQPLDIFVLNTCSVTERADRECRQVIRRTLRHSPDAYVVVTGCYAQLQPGEVAAIDGVDLVLGSNEKFDIFTHAGDFLKNSASQVFVSCIDETTEFNPAFSAEVGGRTRAFLKIQDGCDYHCSFCTIPGARGASRSLDAGIALRQMQQLARQGFKEVVLTGVNVGDYSSPNAPGLYALMKQLELVEGVERIRISSIEPNLLSREMVDHVLASEKFCNHFHIPLQSGSNGILKLMRRRYVREHYRDLAEYIKAKDPDACIGTDVIVGFPGETESLFEETYRFLAGIPVSYLHVFTYSEREQTDAVEFDGRVEPRIRFRRNELLRNLGREKRLAFHRSFIGKTLPVLFEHAQPGGTVAGLTTNYLRTEVAGTDALTNTVCSVRIADADHERCLGSFIRPSTNSEGTVSKLRTNLYDQSSNHSPVMAGGSYRTAAAKELR